MDRMAEAVKALIINQRMRSLDSNILWLCHMCESDVIRGDITNKFSFALVEKNSE